MWWTSLFWLHSFFSMSFFAAFFVYSLPLLKWRTCWMTAINIHNIIIGTILFDDIMSEWSKNMKISRNLILAGWHFQKTWYYFRLCFSFSCSSSDLILIKKSHTLNSYLFLQKFLLKIKTYKLVVGNCGS